MLLRGIDRCITSFLFTFTLSGVAASAAAPPARDALTEGAASQWDAMAQSATANVFDDTTRVHDGAYSLRFETDGGFDTWLWSPIARDGNWDLTYFSELRFWVYAENPSPYNFQNNSPWIRLGTGPTTTNYFQYQTGQSILNAAVNQWYEMRIPLAGDATWSRTVIGSPSLANIDYIEIHADTWDYSFTLWFDDMEFEATPVNPTGLAALAGDGEVALSWNDYIPRPDFDHFAIYRDTVDFASVAGKTPLATLSDGNLTSFLDDSVINGTAYYYAITAVNTQGSEDTNVEAIGPRIPTTPGVLDVTPFYSTTYLAWDAVPGTDVAGYEIYRSTVSGIYTDPPIQRVLLRTEYSDYGLTPGGTYFYKVVAINGDGNGIAQAAGEQSVTLGTDAAGLSVHKNMELLIAVYTGGYTTTQVDRMTAGLKKGLELYWRTSRGQLNMDVTWMYIDADTPGTATGWGDAALMADLRSRGVQDDQYDLAYLVGQDLAGCFGGYVVFNSTCASLGTICGVAYPGRDTANVDYTIAWTFTHEIHHALETMENRTGSVTPEVLFCHFPWAYPAPLGPTGWHMDWAAHFDGIAQTNRAYGAAWLNYPAPYDGYIECVDADGDGLPDDDARVWQDEARFGSSDLLADSEGDGLNDLAEYSAYNFRGTDPWNDDSDGDGKIDGEDHQPLYRISPYIPYARTTPVIDGAIEDSWPVLETGYYFTLSPLDFDLVTYMTFDREYLYLAFESERQLRFKISLDGSGQDGRFESPVRHVSGHTDTNNSDNKGNHFGDSWGDGNHLYTFFGANVVQVYGRGTVPGSTVVSSVDTSDGLTYMTEIRLPRALPAGAAYTWYPSDAPVVDGLTLDLGHLVGLNVTVSNYAGSDGAEFSGQWTNLFETHSYVDFILNPAGDVDVDGDRDLVDFAAFQECYSDGLTVDVACDVMDFDGDGDVDLSDLEAFVAVLGGP